ncbi:MAG: Dimethylamine corrinoid protein [Candidatus Heimdallarchaeota archaeon LC_2]|nr:MAG: Dimethylamine corrinoid protein [Candidatus Heimdallarchaeota archaeon LC_2]
MQIFQQISKALVEGEADLTIKLVQKCINDKIDVNLIIDEGLAVGIKQAGDYFEEGEFFLPELMQGAEIMKSAMDLLRPLIIEQKGDKPQTKGTVVIGTVSGDIHDIGKTLVGSMLTASGFEVKDLGADVSIDRFIETAEELKADFICLSALLTTTMLIQRDLIQELENRNLRDKYIVFVGGAPINQKWANEINANRYAENAVAAVKLATELIQNG